MASSTTRQMNSTHGAHGTTNLNEIEEYKPRKYDDFETISWHRDIAQSRVRSRRINREKKSSWLGWIKALFDAWSGWLCVLIVGCLTGFVIASIDIATSWASDLKNGVCSYTFWFNKEQCCWTDNTTFFEGLDEKNSCSEWSDWPSVFGATGNASSYIAGYFTFTCWALIFATIATMFPRVFAPYASGSGVPEVKTILSGFIMHGFLGMWTLLVKSVALVLAVASGLALGKEGPMVHIGSCVGNIVARFFPKYSKNEAKRREILSAACAAGVACAFGTPLGGVLFSLEEVSYYFPLKTLWRSFFCCLVAFVTVILVNPYGTDRATLLQTVYTHPYDWLEFIPFALLGVFGGLWGSLFIRLNIKWCRYRKTSVLGQYPISEVILMTLITALVTYPIIYTRLDTAYVIHVLVAQCGMEDKSDLCDYDYDSVPDRGVTAAETIPDGKPGEGVATALWQLCIALVVKTLLTTLTIGMKIPAGIYIPSMAAGAITGRIVGITLQYMLPALEGTFLEDLLCKSKGGGGCINPGLYAMVGAAGFLGGTTRMTVALVTIMMELTGSVRYVVPVMAAVMFSKWVGDALGHKGFNEAHIRLNGYPFLDNKEEFVYSTLAADAMRPRKGDPPLEVLTQDSMTVDEIEELLRVSLHNGFPVVVSLDSPYLVGFVTRHELREALDYALANEEGAVGESICLFTDTSMVPSQSYNVSIGSNSDVRQSAVPKSATYPNETGDLSSVAASTSAVVAAGGPTVVRLRRIVDFCPMTVTDQTPMETVTDMFRKLGLRQMLVTHHSRLLGIITKKDVLQHILEREEADVPIIFR